MASEQNLTVYERNDPVITLAATKNASALDLTGLDIEFVVKAKAADLDTSGTILTIGAGVTVTNATSGVFEVKIPSTAITNPGQKVYHADVLDGTDRHTVLAGKLTVKDI